MGAHFIEPSIAAAQGHRGLDVYRAVLCSAMRFEFPPSQLLVRIFSRVMIDSTARAAPGPSVPNFAGCTTTDRLRHPSSSFHGAEEEKGISAQQWMMGQQCKTSETRKTSNRPWRDSELRFWGLARIGVFCHTPTKDTRVACGGVTLRRQREGSGCGSRSLQHEIRRMPQTRHLRHTEPIIEARA